MFHTRRSGATTRGLPMLALTTLAIALAAPLFGGSALAQPSMDSLWPNTDGLRWDYAIDMVMLEVQASGAGYLALDGMRGSAGGPVQNLIGESNVDYPAKGMAVLAGAQPPPALRPWLQTLWISRPDLRAELEQFATTMGKQFRWPASFIHDGGFDKQPTLIQMWQDLGAPTWRYLEDDISVGASFTVGLLPGIADDIFLHAEILELDALVDTPAGMFANGVRVGYRVDLGTQHLTDENGIILGTTTGEITGQVVYVPGVGPVLENEQHTPFLTADCGSEACPPRVIDLIGVVVLEIDLALLKTPVPNVRASWGALKADYGD